MSKHRAYDKPSMLVKSLVSLFVASIILWATYITREAHAMRVEQAITNQLLKSSLEFDKLDHALIKTDVKDLYIKFEELLEKFNNHKLKGHRYAKK